MKILNLSFLSDIWIGYKTNTCFICLIEFIQTLFYDCIMKTLLLLFLCQLFFLIFLISASGKNMKNNLEPLKFLSCETLIVHYKLQTQHLLLKQEILLYMIPIKDIWQSMLDLFNTVGARYFCAWHCCAYNHDF